MAWEVRRISDTFNDLQGKLFLAEEQQKTLMISGLLGPMLLEDADKVPYDGAMNHDHYLVRRPGIGAAAFKL